jgi:uncharacterized protein
MDRLYTQLIKQHFTETDMMLFLAGPRQVGKTYAAKAVAAQYKKSIYLNWDEIEHRELILKGSGAIAEHAGINQIMEEPLYIVFDEIHKYSQWKNFLKGFYDLYQQKTHIVATGSASLKTFSKGGDSLMGRYFPYHMHPLTVNEIVRPRFCHELLQTPQEIDTKTFATLYEFGGYPKPFLQGSAAFSNRWHNLRREQLVYEDIRDMTRIQELSQLEVMVEMLRHNSSGVLNYSNLAKALRVSQETAKRWLKTLEAFYYCFSIKPWHKNVSRSLIKEPKLYLRDWSQIKDPGAKFETFIAAHLYKAVQWWTDTGLGQFDLFYIRDLQKREVDFIVTREQEPWFLVEAKLNSRQAISKSLYHFHEILKVPRAFQVCMDLPFSSANCFDESHPVKAPAISFLSQLV